MSKEALRTPAKYDPPRYSDPDDLRLVQIVRQADKSMPRSVNIVGVPYDGAVLGRKGAEGGPSGIRHAMSGFSNYDVDKRIGLSAGRFFDLGDIVVEGGVLDVHSQIEREVGRCLRDDSLLAILGGDNSVSLPALRAFGERFGETGLLVIDSHLDLRGKIGGKPTSGSSYGLAVETVKGLSPRRVAEVGIHGFLNSQAYAEKAEKLGIRVVTAGEVRKAGPLAVAEEAWSVVSRGSDAVYLSVDADAVDLAQVSGVSAPSAGGIDSVELFEMVRWITRQAKVKCADIVEVAPSLDPTGRSSIVAATALVEMLAGFQGRSPD